MTRDGGRKKQQANGNVWTPLISMAPPHSVVRVYRKLRLADIPWPSSQFNGVIRGREGKGRLVLDSFIEYSI